MPAPAPPLKAKREADIQARVKFLLITARLVWAGVLACALFAAWTLAAPRARPAAPAAAPVDIGPELSAFYRARGFAPVWVADDALRPEAAQLLAMLGDGASGELRRAVAAAQDGEPHRLTRADLLLSQAYGTYAAAHLAAPARNAMRYIDPGLAPAPPSPRAALEAAAAAPSLAHHLAAVERINPVLDGLTRGLANYRARWSHLPQEPLPARPSAEALRYRLGGIPLVQFQAAHSLPATGRADPATIAALNRGAAYYERLIAANIERARAIPAHPDGRYILVDTASARLWTIDQGRITGAMRVVVGKRAMPTPLMAGMIRYASLNPYWNVPPDLIRKRARGGARAIAAEHLQALSDWTPQARVLDPRRVDWRAVAAGRRLVNLRQTPGATNMMGRIKFMLPNDLGVYLHDTPLRDLLRRADRHESSGCVRLENAAALGRWLFGGRVPAGSGAPEERADLPAPVPVYLAYFTALPSRGGVVFHEDVYRRDGAAALPRSTSRRNRIRPAK